MWLWTRCGWEVWGLRHFLSGRGRLLVGNQPTRGLDEDAQDFCEPAMKGVEAGLLPGSFNANLNAPPILGLFPRSPPLLSFSRARSASPP